MTNLIKFGMTALLLFTASLCQAESTKPSYNPLTGRFDYITRVDSTSIPSGSTQYIQNTSALQSGATFYVSSGTIATALTITPITNSVLATNAVGLVVSTSVPKAFSLYTSTGDQTINTTNPTTAHAVACVGTTTVNANYFSIGSKFQIRGQGVYSTPIGNISTVTITIKYGTTTLATVTTGALPASASNLPFGIWVDCTVRAIGASGTMICNGSFAYDTALTGVVETQNALISNAVTVDTTASKVIDTLGSWSATTTQTATVQQSSILMLN